MSIRIGMNIGHRNPDATRRAAQAAEAAGLDYISMGDAQVHRRECYAMLTLCALATERIGLALIVTNPLTRHPTVTADAMATVNEISKGRAVLGIGRGNASVLNAKMDRAHPKVLGEAIDTIRSAWGQVANSTWPRLGWTEPPTIPILVHTSGRPTAQVAADHADGVVFRWGDEDPERLGERIAWMRAARAKGPRAGDPFAVWGLNTVVVTDDPERAKKTVDLAYRLLSLPEREWPPAFASRIREYRGRYQWPFHASKTNKTNKRILDELGLTELTYARSAFIDTPERIGARMAELGRVGVDAVVCSLEDEDPASATDERRIADVAAIRRAARA